MASGKRRRAASDMDVETSEIRSTTPSGTRDLAIPQSRRTRCHSAQDIAGSDFVPTDEDGGYENDECEDERTPSERGAVQAGETKKQTRRSPGDHLRKVAAAVPCHGDYASMRIYSDAHKSQSRVAAYVGFNDLASMHSYILSAAFLPAYVIFKDTGAVWFKRVLNVLQDPMRHDEREENMSDLFLALERRRANDDDEADKLGDAVKWLVHRSAEVKNWSREQQDSALDNAHKALRTQYHDVDAIPRTYLRTESALPLWQHPQDPQPEVEQYHRALQLLRYCERPEHLGAKRRKAEKWTDFWQDGDILKSRSVSSILIPPWMRKQSEGQETLASTEEDGEEHWGLTLTDTNALPREQAGGDGTVGGTQEGQPLEQIARDETMEQEFQLKGTITGGDSVTPIEIIDSDEDLVQDHQHKVELKTEDRTTSLETIDEMAQLPLRPACQLLYVSDRVLSRDLCTNVEWFDECWDRMERREELPTGVIATADPRNWSCDKDWRDAVRQELRLGTRWRRRNNNGLALKLMALRLEAPGERLDCYDPDPEASDFNCTHEEVIEFVNRHEMCQILYHVDFFTNEEIENGLANDFETSIATGNA